MCNKQNPGRQVPGFFYHYCEQLSFIFLKNGIKQCKEGNRCHSSSYDIAYRFCKKYRKNFIVEEVRQNEDQRYQQDDLTQAGKKQTDFRLAESHKALLAAYLEANREDSGHVDAECPGSVCYKFLI